MVDEKENVQTGSSMEGNRVSCHQTCNLCKSTFQSLINDEFPQIARN